MADDFSPSAVVTTARRDRSAVICFSMVSRISSGGLMFFSSMRITLTPHCCVALSSAARSWALIVSRDDSVWSRSSWPTTLRSAERVSCSMPQRRFWIS